MGQRITGVTPEPRPTIVPLIADAAAALAAVPDGTTIRFNLAPGRDTAYARVLLPGAAPAAACGDALSQATSSGQGSEELLLRLTWLGVEAGSVGGWLAPYHDPEAGCVMDIWFEGSYFARPADGTPLRIGSWEVRRER